MTRRRGNPEAERAGLAEPHVDAAEEAAIAEQAPAPPHHAARDKWGLGVGLSDNQRKAVRSAITVLAIFVVVAALGALGRLIAQFLRSYSHVFLPLAVAGIFALVLNPYFEWLRHRLRLPSGVAVIVVVLTLLLPLAGFFWFFGALVVDQVSDLVHRVPAWWDQMVLLGQRRWPQVQRFLQENPLGQKIREAATNQAGAMAASLGAVGSKAWSAGALVLHWLGLLVTWAVLPVYFVFFLLADRATFRDWESHVLPFLKPQTRRDVVFLGTEFVRLVVTFFRGQLIIAGIQAVLYATAFSLLGLRYGFILGLCLGFLNLVPYLGSIIVMSVALPLAFFQDGGGWWLVASVLAVFAAIHLFEGYVLTPRIMGGRTGLHPVAVIVAVFFWGTAFGGILGMILAIPLTAFLVVAWRLAKEKYIREWI
ncbi:MAG TPA: AI-2E family transporter [Thermoanaerobaculia bacterium]|nr:AI-2E family transporter [Thermoanaerobaculia bacterium]